MPTKENNSRCCGHYQLLLSSANGQKLGKNRCHSASSQRHDVAIDAVYRERTLMNGCCNSVTFLRYALLFLLNHPESLAHGPDRFVA